MAIIKKNKYYKPKQINVKKLQIFLSKQKKDEN